MSNTYAVIFKGEILEGADASSTRQKVGAIFKANEAKINALFSGKPVAIKKGVDEATAKKFVSVFANAGAKAYAKNMAENATSAPAAEAKPTPPPAATPSKPANTSETTKESSPATQPPETTVTPSAGNASSLAFESSSTVEPAPPPQTVVNIQPQNSVDDLSLGAEGGFVGGPSEVDNTPPPEVPSELSLSDNTGNLAPPKQDTTPAPDVPDLEMEPMNSGSPSMGKATFSLDP